MLSQVITANRRRPPSEYEVDCRGSVHIAFTCECAETACACGKGHTYLRSPVGCHWDRPRLHILTQQGDQLARPVESEPQPTSIPPTPL